MLIQHFRLFFTKLLKKFIKLFCLFFTNLIKCHYLPYTELYLMLVKDLSIKEKVKDLSIKEKGLSF